MQDGLVIVHKQVDQLPTDIDRSLQSLGSLMTGPTAPTTTYPNMWWADTTLMLLKKRNNANTAWVTVGLLDTANLGLLLVTDFVSEAYIYIRDEKASGTDGGTFTSGAWQTRTLNTEVSDTGNNASIASNQITLAAGTYRFKARCPALAAGNHKCRLQNVTDGTTIQIGSNERSGSTDNTGTNSFVSDRFTIAAGKALELQHQCSSTLATVGFGGAASFGVVEVYAEIEFLKEN